MMLTLTIKENESKMFDIQVPSTQRIKDTLNVLMENKLIHVIEHEMYQVFSTRANRSLEIKKTYEENYVFTADILTITYREENQR